MNEPPYDHINVFMILLGILLIMSSLFWAIAWATVRSNESADRKEERKCPGGS